MLQREAAAVEFKRRCAAAATAATDDVGAAATAVAHAAGADAANAAASGAAAAATERDRIAGINAAGDTIAAINAGAAAAAAVPPATGVTEEVTEFTLACRVIESADTPSAKRPKAWRCRLNPVEGRVKSALFQRVKLKCDEPFSSFAFNFKLRRFIKVDDAEAADDSAGDNDKTLTA